MGFSGPIEDRIQIRERMGAYADASFRRDREAWLANWTEACVWVGPGFRLEGKPALKDSWDKLWARQEAMTFFTEIGAIEVQGERAKARCFTLERLKVTAGGQEQYVGRYDDELVREGGFWLFAKRSWSLVMGPG